MKGGANLGLFNLLEPWISFRALLSGVPSEVVRSVCGLSSILSCCHTGDWSYLCARVDWTFEHSACRMFSFDSPCLCSHGRASVKLHEQVGESGQHDYHMHSALAL